MLLNRTIEPIKYENCLKIFLFYFNFLMRLKNILVAIFELKIFVMNSDDRCREFFLTYPRGSRFARHDENSLNQSINQSF